MDAAQHDPTLYSLEEYVALENDAIERHEYWQGEIRTVESASLVHSQIRMNVMVSLRAQLRGRPYSALGINQRLRVELADLTAYPDVLIISRPESMSEADPMAVTEANTIIEVLSADTTHRDKDSKFNSYGLLPSLRHYLLIDQRRVEVEHRFRREDGRWAAQIFRSLQHEIKLSAIDCRLRVSEIYDEIEF
jgi:Uma2 family endonuclease